MGLQRREIEVKVWRSFLHCDRCGTEQQTDMWPSGMERAPKDWLTLGGSLNSAVDDLHFCPACAPEAIRGARGR